MKRLDAEKMITLITNDFNDVDNITAGNLLALLEDSIVDEAEKVAPDPIIEVWEKFKYLRILFNDENWFDMNDQIHKSFHECFKAIEKYAEGKGKK
jgi:hypothetical protein